MISQVLLLLYLELIECVNLFPWNDIRNGNGQEGLDITMGIIMLIAIAAAVKRWWWVMAASTMFYGSWLWLQTETFWIAYFRGASPQWQRAYAHLFGGTIKILPADQDHLPADACHLLLEVLVAVALVSSAAATVKERRRL
jgi:hypothetical protein